MSKKHRAPSRDNSPTCTPHRPYVTKRYGAKTAVDSVSFTAPSGSVTGFLCPNGAGKSTTMRVIVGLDAPNKGDRSC